MSYPFFAVVVIKKIFFKYSTSQIAAYGGFIVVAVECLLDLSSTVKYIKMDIKLLKIWGCIVVHCLLTFWSMSTC